MSEYINDAHEIGWDDEISNDGGQYIILEEGDYNFTVSTFERARFPGSAKIPACNKAVLTLAVDTSNGVAFVKYDLILWYLNSSGQLARRSTEKSYAPSGALWLAPRGEDTLSPANTIRKTGPRVKPTMWKDSMISTPASSLGHPLLPALRPPRPMLRLHLRLNGQVSSDGATSISKGSH